MHPDDGELVIPGRDYSAMLPDFKKAMEDVSAALADVGRSMPTQGLMQFQEQPWQSVEPAEPVEPRDPQPEYPVRPTKMGW